MHCVCACTRVHVPWAARLSLLFCPACPSCQSWPGWVWAPHLPPAISREMKAQGSFLVFIQAITIVLRRKLEDPQKHQRIQCPGGAQAQLQARHRAGVTGAFKGGLCGPQESLAAGRRQPSPCRVETISRLCARHGAIGQPAEAMAWISSAASPGVGLAPCISAPCLARKLSTPSPGRLSCTSHLHVGTCAVGRRRKWPPNMGPALKSFLGTRARCMSPGAQDTERRVRCPRRDMVPGCVSTAPLPARSTLVLLFQKTPVPPARSGSVPPSGPTALQIHLPVSTLGAAEGH